MLEQTAESAFRPLVARRGAGNRCVDGRQCGRCCRCQNRVPELNKFQASLGNAPRRSMVIVEKKNDIGVVA